LKTGTFELSVGCKVEVEFEFEFEFGQHRAVFISATRRRRGNLGQLLSLWRKSCLISVSSFAKISAARFDLEKVQQLSRKRKHICPNGQEE